MEDGTSAIPGNSCYTSHGSEIRRILDRVGDKWTILVIGILDGGTRRFSELRREIEGISQRMLTLTLRQLERDGLVSRTVYPVVPPRVEYRLTELGATLHQSVQSLVTWAAEHRAEVTKARAAYDAREEEAEVAALTGN
jgi:DNA-binding HxlR family transcriptional regulator